MKGINKIQSQKQKTKQLKTTHAHYVKLIKLLELHKLVEINHNQK